MEDTIYKEIGRRIAEARKSAEKSQAEVAQEAGISRASLVNIEQGRQSVYIHTLLAICKSLGVQPMELLGESFDVKGTINELAEEPEVQGWLGRVLSEEEEK